MTSGRGFSLVQLVIAFRWMTPMCPQNGFGIANIVRDALLIAETPRSVCILSARSF
jgi:hypothetical protein